MYTDPELSRPVTSCVSTAQSRPGWRLTPGQVEQLSRINGNKPSPANLPPPTLNKWLREYHNNPIIRRGVFFTPRQGVNL